VQVANKYVIAVAFYSV